MRSAVAEKDGTKGVSPGSTTVDDERAVSELQFEAVDEPAGACTSGSGVGIVKSVLIVGAATASRSPGRG